MSATKTKIAAILAMTATPSLVWWVVSGDVRAAPTGPCAAGPLAVEASPCRCIRKNAAG
jgi:hypothetical protein